MLRRKLEAQDFRTVRVGWPGLASKSHSSALALLRSLECSASEKNCEARLEYGPAAGTCPLSKLGSSVASLSDTSCTSAMLLAKNCHVGGEAPVLRIGSYS